MAVPLVATGVLDGDLDLVHEIKPCRPLLWRADQGAGPGEGSSGLRFDIPRAG